MPSNHLILCCPLLLLLSVLPASGSFPISWLLTSGGQIIGASASASVLTMNTQDWFPLRLTGLNSLMSKGISRVFSSNTVWKHKFFTAWPSLWSNSHIHTWLWEKSYMDLCQQLMPLLFNTLSRFLIAFLPRTMYLLISWLQSPSAVILEPKKIKSVTVSIFPHLFAIKGWCQMSWS